MIRLYYINYCNDKETITTSTLANSMDDAARHANEMLRSHPYNVAFVKRRGALLCKVANGRCYPSKYYCSPVQ